MLDIHTRNAATSSRITKDAVTVSRIEVGATTAI
jgi:hypothetical protein